ncbi:SUKH-4 family immunity protein [Pelagicoccus sp. SDUM812002]|uniref:SUKH-4 family immunity protein n=1 Tax=Pelagicoccus sp. SDUM812002 TaxID=3041266 RepID=UPI00280EACBC|nr:SUKH-4 family immunity protein [Pelagicoccus sp. SDUM812002]MDQ8188519.1 SUKH-4 family immunity protein [Pelagicoccus sp. SDUM812002]
MKELTTIEDSGELLASILNGSFEVGMLEMGKEKNSFPVPDGFTAIGEFECDPVAIKKETNEVVVLDHEVLGRVMTKAASSIKEFIEALSLIYDYFESDDLDDEDEEDEEEMKRVAEAASLKAGGKDYQSLWHMFFGV